MLNVQLLGSRRGLFIKGLYRKSAIIIFQKQIANNVMFYQTIFCKTITVLMQTRHRKLLVLNSSFLKGSIALVLSQKVRGDSVYNVL